MAPVGRPDTTRTAVSPGRAQRGGDLKVRLLGAAARIPLRGGPEALTLEAVAREAGTSKGGLLYHYPSKARLKEALLEDVIAGVRSKLVYLVRADPDPTGRRIRAYADALVDPLGADERRGVLSMLPFDPVARDRWRTFIADWIKPDLEDIDPERANVIRALADGCWVIVALGLGPKGDVERAAALRCMLRLPFQPSGGAFDQRPSVGYPAERPNRGEK